MSEQGKPAAVDSIAEHIRWAVDAWPQIDPEVEGIVSRVDKINRHFQNAFRASLGQAGVKQRKLSATLRQNHAERFPLVERDRVAGRVIFRFIVNVATAQSVSVQTIAPTPRRSGP
jgi:hypothetical protein